MNKNKGQSLLELIVAIGIILACTIATLTLVITSIQAGRKGSDKIIATNLAREGIEIVRNIRDSNWLSGNSWNERLSSEDWQVVSMNGQATKFQRRVIITPGANTLHVLIEVRWLEKGRNRQVAAQTVLYNWK